MASIIAYLENYVESTVGLPSDLARFLNTIRVLDERATEVEAALRQTTEALCALKPVGSRAGGPDNTVSSSKGRATATGSGTATTAGMITPSAEDEAVSAATPRPIQLSQYDRPGT